MRSLLTLIFMLCVRYFESKIAYLNINIFFFFFPFKAAEDVNLKHRPLLKEILQYMDKAFTILFLFEMLLKWLAFGFQKYFTNAWCWLDFVIVLVRMKNLLIKHMVKVISK